MDKKSSTVEITMLEIIIVLLSTLTNVAHLVKNASPMLGSKSCDGTTTFQNNTIPLTKLLFPTSSGVSYKRF